MGIVKEEGSIMNFDRLRKMPEGVKEQLKSWWRKLTSEDLHKIEGNNEQLFAILQKRYGWSKKQTKKEINKKFEEYKEQYLKEEEIFSDIGWSGRPSSQFLFTNEDVAAEMDYENANEFIVEENDTAEEE